MYPRSIYFLVFILTVASLVYGEIYRLPKTVKPIRYYLTLEPHLRNTDVDNPMLYNGSVLIDLQIFEDTRAISLHERELLIDNSSITVINSKGDDMKVSETSIDEPNQIYTIHLESELVKSETYTLNIGKFTGKLGHSNGFFRAFYEVDGNTRTVAATHFEPTEARRAFPCFDEPTFKAKFVVSLIRKTEYTSVSNEKLENTENLGNGRFKDTFKETPLMSTFLLAFAVTDFKYSKKLERHRILARPESIDNGEYKYALQIANRTLKALEQYTGIDFLIDKMDHIAIPDGYFDNFAMENWRLVVYIETRLMRNNTSPAEDYQKTTIIIAHELAHQWFGNLVTPSWWDHLWLAESFAAYFEYYIADIIQPTWRLNDQFLVDKVQFSLLAEEYLVDAYPLNANITYSGQYPPYHIMYLKGSSIIRMMEHFVTHDVFKRALQIYLEMNKFKNVEPSDLYAAFQEAVDKAGVNNILDNKTIAEIMTTWDSNSGYPIITVTRDYKTGSVTFEQKTGITDHDNSTITKWIIPINYAFSAGKTDFSKTTADYWLAEESATINHDFLTDGWLIVNKQQTGYYRVNYDLQNWERIIKTLKSDDFKSIHVLNRAQLIDDSFSFAHNKMLPMDIPFRLCEYIVHETDYIPLSSFYKALERTTLSDYGSLLFDGARPNPFDFLGNEILTENLTEYDVYDQYVRTTLDGVKDALGFEDKPDDTHLDKLHRSKFKAFEDHFNTE